MVEQLSGEKVLDHLTNRLFLVYEQFFGLERARLDFKLAQATVARMLQKLIKDFNAMVGMVSHKDDKLLSFWVDIEAELNTVIDTIETVAFGYPDLFGQLRSLILSFQKEVKAQCGVEKAAGIS